MRRLAWLLLALPVLAGAAPPKVRLVRLVDDTRAELVLDGRAVTAERGGRCGPWTLVELLPPEGKGSPRAVLEDYGQWNGHLLLIGPDGVESDFAKSSEPTRGDPAKLYLGHNRTEVLESARDLLGSEILARPGDPEYETVAGVFEPIRK